jgi:hypothetical protein
MVRINGYKDFLTAVAGKVRHHRLLFTDSVVISHSIQKPVNEKNATLSQLFADTISLVRPRATGTGTDCRSTEDQGCFFKVGS